MASQLGKPAINDPRGQQWNNDQLRNLQQIVGNIRERFRTVDDAVSTLQATTAGVSSSTGADVTALKKRVTALEQALSALEAKVNGLETGAGADTDPRVEQMAGELDTLRRQVSSIDTVGQTATLAAALPGMQRQLDQLSCGVLI